MWEEPPWQCSQKRVSGGEKRVQWAWDGRVPGLTWAPGAAAPGQSPGLADVRCWMPSSALENENINKVEERKRVWSNRAAEGEEGEGQESGPWRVTAEWGGGA